MEIMDRLVNLVSGLGTKKDKMTHNHYFVTELPPQQLFAAYRSDWMARKVVSIPAEDATREWRQWQGTKEQISALEAEENRLNLPRQTMTAEEHGRLLGGGAIVIGVDGAGDWEDPIDLNRVKRGSLKYIHAVDRYEISAGMINRDLTSPHYGEPSYYNITSERTGNVRVHPSRVVRFVPFPMPSRQLEHDGWGDSVLLALDSAIKNAGYASDGVASLITEASIDVIRVPDFMTNLASAEYRSKIIERFQLANTAKSTINTLMLDKEEEWERKTVNFANLPESVRLYLSIAAAAADIPATRFLGDAPSGLNATGEGDERNYEAKIGSEQKNRIGPALHRLDEILIRSALGERPPELHYNWRPLRQPTDAEKADTLQKRSIGIANIYNTGLIPTEAFAKGVQNMMIEDGSFPGLEAAINEDDELDEDDPDAQDQFDRGRS